MSETSDPHPSSTSPVRAAEPPRAAALQDLADALALLGDDASRATNDSRDVRLHIVACQAEHLAAELRTLTATKSPDHELPAAGGFAASSTAARRAYERATQEPLPATLGASLHRLLLLAEAAAP
jgi:hypothetical protein